MHPALVFSGSRKAVWVVCLAVVLARAARSQTPPETTFFSTAAEEAYSTLQVTGGNGDLWPSCWADDNNLYAASGDGNAFGGPGSDMLVSKISGTPPTLSGETLARNIAQTGAAAASGADYVRNRRSLYSSDGQVQLGQQLLGYCLRWIHRPEEDIHDAPGRRDVTMI